MGSVRPLGISTAADELGIGMAALEKMIRLGKVKLDGDDQYALINVDTKRNPKCVPVAPPITDAFYAIRLFVIGSSDAESSAKINAELVQMGFEMEGPNTSVTPTNRLKVGTIQEMEDRLRPLVQQAKVRISFEGYKRTVNEPFF